MQDFQFGFRQEREEAHISPEEAELMMNLHAQRRYSTLSEMAAMLHVSEAEAASLLGQVRGRRVVRPNRRFGTGVGAAAVALVLALVVWVGFFGFMRLLHRAARPRFEPAIYAEPPGIAATPAPEPPDVAIAPNGDEPVIVQTR